MENKQKIIESLPTDVNTIRQIDPQKMFFATKECLIDTLKKNVGDENMDENMPNQWEENLKLLTYLQYPEHLF